MFIKFIKKILPPVIRKRISAILQDIRMRREMYRLNQLVKNNFPDCNLIFDIGANVGDFTYVYSKSCSKVISVEPQKELYSYLKNRFKNNKKVIVENVGVSNKLGHLRMYIDNKNKAMGSFNKDWNKSWGNEVDNSYFVKVITLDKLIEKYGLPDYIKIDVEGYEYVVLQGLSHKTKYLSFEFHNKVLPDVINRIELLHSLGYTRFNLSFDQKLKFKDWIPLKKLISVLKSEDINFCGDIYCK